MTLNNIVLFVDADLANSYADSKSYPIIVFPELTAFKDALNSLNGKVYKRIVIQLTLDQYGEGNNPRVVMDVMEIDEPFDFIDIASLSAPLQADIEAIKVLVEAQITPQIIA